MPFVIPPPQHKRSFCVFLLSGYPVFITTSFISGEREREMESGLTNGVLVPSADDKSVVGGGGVKDVYGEDSATEDQLVTPWTVSVAR